MLYKPMSYSQSESGSLTLTRNIKDTIMQNSIVQAYDEHTIFFSFTYLKIFEHSYFLIWLVFTAKLIFCYHDFDIAVLSIFLNL